MKNRLDFASYRGLARRLAAEGCVLLKNENKALPFAEGTRVALFGRAQSAYYKSGTGSGGMVNAKYVASIAEALSQEKGLTLDAGVKAAYAAFVEENPFDRGVGWAAEPWYQKEMPLDPALAQAAASRCDAAVIVFGRTAGEDQDNKAEKGSYYLTDEEENTLRTVCAAFSRTVVLLNVGNVIDMSWVEKYAPSAVVYLWHGGEMGAYAAADILTGRENPSGRLTDTISRMLEDQPAYETFGDPVCTPYSEDIYVGYRYFETFAKDKVLYPFGFGLSYTSFSIRVLDFKGGTDGVRIRVRVTNTGTVRGKEVVQLYYAAPQGALGKPARVLCAFAKTNVLAPNECQELELSADAYRLASFDDSGASGYKDAYVLEKGLYAFYIGEDVRAKCCAGSFILHETVCVQQLSEALAPVTPFKRLKPAETNAGYSIICEDAALRTIDPDARIRENLPRQIPYTGDRGIKLCDVAEGRAAMEDFIAQLDRDELVTIVRGEGMCSPKVTPGVAGAFGGVTDKLIAKGIPIAACSDGPGGIRMDCGSIAVALPIGTCIACSFNEALTTELFADVGLELRRNRIDTLLGPGMNLHRYVLNGRNFEYFSEDPLVTGLMAKAELIGMHPRRVTGTIKHFACNNQEFRRNEVDAVVSARALRELYLKGFEIAVREGGAYCIMSSYNKINGVHTASSYDLLTTILRGEWGYTGLVMTDWWAKGNFEGEPDARTAMGAQVRAQNDIYMVARNAQDNSNGDDSLAMLESGRVTLAEYQRSAANICSNLIRMPAFSHPNGRKDAVDLAMEADTDGEDNLGADACTVDENSGVCTLDCEALRKPGDLLFQVRTDKPGKWTLTLTLLAQVDDALAQTAVSVFHNRDLVRTVSLSGLDKGVVPVKIDLGIEIQPSFYVRFHSLGGVAVEKAELTREEAEIPRRA